MRSIGFDEKNLNFNVGHDKFKVFFLYPRICFTWKGGSRIQVKVGGVCLGTICIK
jgi:hypothetical protein